MSTTITRERPQTVDVRVRPIAPTPERVAEPGGRRVLVVDDHRSFADLLALALETVDGLRCVATASTTDEALEAALRHRPDVVLVDIELGEEDGLIATRRLLALLPDALVAVVTAHNDPAWVSRAAQVGASAFIPKDCSLPEIVAILRSMEPGQLRVAPRVWEHDRLTQVEPRPSGGLTPRETDVLGRLGHGDSVKVAARALGISVHTCRGYVKSLHAKLGATNQLELLVKAQRLGLLVAARS